MEIGIGLPATIPGTRGSLVLDWAGRADSGPFSSLGIIDRLVYTNYEPLVTLAAAAAVTERGRLMSTVLIAPLRGPTRARRYRTRRYRRWFLRAAGCDAAQEVIRRT